MMNEPVIDEVVARKFLLGQLSPEEQGEIEALAFEDPDTFRLLELLEDELIDDFLQDKLSQPEEQRFEEHFLTFPGRRESLEISRLLQKHLSQVESAEFVIGQARSQELPMEVELPSVITDDDDRNFSFIGWFKQQSIGLQLSMAIIAIALLIIAVVLIRARMARQSEPVQAGRDTPLNVVSPQPQISPSLQPSPSPVHVENKRKSPTPQKQKPVVTYGTLLMPSAKPRSGGGPQLQLPPDASSVSVGLALIERKTYKTYDVTLLNEAGTKIDDWSNLEEQRLAATGAFRETRGLLIEVKTVSLKPDESYRIEVTGLSSKGKRIPLQGYSFQAKK